MALVLPALMLSLRARRSAKDSGLICQTNPLVLVGCLLLLLFPVISVTDDLLAAGLEIEESGAAKRLVKQSAAPKSSIAFDGTGAPSHPVNATSFAADNEQYQAVSSDATVLPQSNLASASGCRAPPCPKSSFLVVPSSPVRPFLLKLDFTVQSVLSTVLQTETPQSNKASQGRRSFKCRTYLLTTRGRKPTMLLGDRRRKRDRQSRLPKQVLPEAESS